MLEGGNGFAWASAVLLVLVPRVSRGRPYQPHQLAAQILTVHRATNPAATVLYQISSQIFHRKRDPADWASMHGQPLPLVASTQVTRLGGLTYSYLSNLLLGPHRTRQNTQVWCKMLSSRLALARTSVLALVRPPPQPIGFGRRGKVHSQQKNSKDNIIYLEWVR